MKITGHGIESFLRRPGAEVICILVYGPDQGLVRERTDTLIRTVTGNINDPFRVVELSGGDLTADPRRLADEAAALALTGGRRVVRVRDAGEAVAKVFEAFLGDPEGDALVVVEAGELGPRSSLRGLCERAANAAALACYGDDGDSLRQVIVESLGRHGLRASRDALAFLAANLGSDRLATRGELDKLALYKGEPGTVELDDAVACVGDNAAMTMDAVIHAAGGGEQSELDRTLARAFSEGVQPVGILRATARHLQRLHLASAMLAAGSSPEQAMKALKPPVFFKFAGRFRDQLQRWSTRCIADALDLVTEAELLCKTSGLPPEVICGRALLRISQEARTGGSRR